MLKLYHFPSSVCVQKVRLVLDELGLESTPILIDIRVGEQFKKDYLRLNPAGVVPTLDHDGRIVIESNVIVEYLADTFPGGDIVRPSDTLDRARMRLWLRKLDVSLHRACGILTGSAIAANRAAQIASSGMSREAYLASVPDPARRESLRVSLEMGVTAPQTMEALKCHVTILKEMAEALEQHPFLAGNAYSLADAGLTPYVVRLDRLGMREMIDRHPRVADWYDRIFARGNFAKAITAFEEPEREKMFMEGGTAAWKYLKPKLEAAGN